MSSMTTQLNGLQCILAAMTMASTIPQMATAGESVSLPANGNKVPAP